MGFIAARDVDLVAMSIGTVDRLEALRRTVEALRAAGRGAELPLMVGGRGVADVAELAGASRVCHSLAEAQQFARSLRLYPGDTDRR